jgi:hypothetical protein
VTYELLEYVNKRMEELTAVKAETLKSLIDVTKEKNELRLEVEKEILESKMKFYLASGTFFRK